MRVLLGDALLQLLLDLLQRLLQALGDLLAGLLGHLRELLLPGADLRAELLQGRGTGHHRHECSIRRHREAGIRDDVGSCQNQTGHWWERHARPGPGAHPRGASGVKGGPRPARRVKALARQTPLPSAS